MLFPNEELRFGDIPAGSTTAYAKAKRGAGPTAAFRFAANGTQVHLQRVIDFVEWKPLPGMVYTYRVRLEFPKRYSSFLRVIEVVQDR